MCVSILGSIIEELLIVGTRVCTGKQGCYGNCIRQVTLFTCDNLIKPYSAGLILFLLAFSVVDGV